MTKSGKFIVLGATAASFLLICAMAGIYGLLSMAPHCSEDKMASASSPDGKYVAIIYQRNCGVGAESYVHVNLFEASKKVHPQLISGRITQGTVFTADWYPRRLMIQWVGPRTLLIDCKDCASNPSSPQVAPEQKTAWRDVSILHKLKN